LRRGRGRYLRGRELKRDFEFPAQTSMSTSIAGSNHGPAITEIDSPDSRGRRPLIRKAHVILSERPPIDVNTSDVAGNRCGNTMGMWESDWVSLSVPIRVPANLCSIGVRRRSAIPPIGCSAREMRAPVASPGRQWVTRLDCGPLQPSKAALQGASASKGARNKGSWCGQRCRAIRCWAAPAAVFTVLYSSV